MTGAHFYLTDVTSFYMKGTMRFFLVLLWDTPGC